MCLRVREYACAFVSELCVCARECENMGACVCEWKRAYKSRAMCMRVRLCLSDVSVLGSVRKWVRMCVLVRTRL